MADESTHLKLPYILANQAQKHVTHNEAIRLLDALVQLSVIDRDLTAPPGSPADGDRYIVGAGATGDWAGWDLNVAYYVDGAWMKLVPQTGWRAWIADESALVAWDGSNWSTVMPDVAEFDGVGIRTSPDANNRLAVKSNAVLFSHDDVTPGTGSILASLNKAAAGNDAGFVFQTNWSTRALFGLLADDDFTIKVSPDGSSFIEAFRADKDTGEATIQGLRSAQAGGAPASSLVFTPGGDGQVSIYRIDGTSAQNPRTATIDSVSGDTITLTTFDAGLFFHDFMDGVSHIRIWNVSKSPEEPAWVVRKPAGNQLQVLDAGDIAGWANGETVQVGDPVTATPNRYMTLDISPMLVSLFGQAFRQTGIMMRATLLNATAGDRLYVSPTGVGGSNVNAAVAQASGAQAGEGVTIIPCTEQSPISNSNLVRVGESLATTAGIRLLSSIAVLK